MTGLPSRTQSLTRTGRNWESSPRSDGGLQEHPVHARAGFSSHQFPESLYAVVFALLKGMFRRLEGAMTVAELIEKLSALPDKTALIVKTAGPWDGLNEPSLIYDGYVDKDKQFPVQATDPDAIHVVYL
jgi:hypothetical protein